jgi:ketosteroid isomerase-like protein
VAIGRGEGALRDGTPLRFVFSDVFTFAGDRISRLETYLVTLN